MTYAEQIAKICVRAVWYGGVVAVLAACVTINDTPGREPPVDPQILERYRTALQTLHDQDYPRAERLFNDLIRVHPQYSGPRANLGLVYLRTGRIQQAIDTLTAAIDINPRPAYLNQLGIAYRQLGKFKQARAAYDKALQIDLSYAPAVLNLGILCDLYFGESDQALTYYRRYQLLQQAPDPEVATWIVDLERRIAGRTQ